MRKILLADAKPGMIIAKNIYNDEGKILLTNGTELKKVYIDKLNGLNIPAVYIKDDLVVSPEPADIISEEIRHNAIASVKDVFHQLVFSETADMKKVSQAVNHMMDQLLANPNIMVNLTDIRSYDNYTFGHCVNVCALSMLTGISLGLNQLQLKDLGIGAILHDIGKITVNKDILNKPAALSDEEFKIVKEHSMAGFDLLRKLDGVSTLAAHVAFQHH
ncbi:MAG: HD domain-containing protein, partial [Bacillota bacterium]|nr:HD domain-containing protein [Bacillota bacterium]